MSDLLFDTNVLLDLATAHPMWSAWWQNQLRAAAERGQVLKEAFT